MANTAQLDLHREPSPMVEIIEALKISSAVVKMVPTLQDVIYKHLDRRSKRKRELADQLASHLSSVSWLFKRSATLLKQRDKRNQIGGVCGQLHAEVDQLDAKVMSKILSKKAATRFLEQGHEAAGVELVAAELLQHKSVNLAPYIASLESISGMFRGLASDAKRKGTRGG